MPVHSRRDARKGSIRCFDPHAIETRRPLAAPARALYDWAMTRTIALLLFLTAALAPRLASAADQPAAEKRGAPVPVGEMAPDFTLEDQDGRKRTLSAERGKPVVLVFYRGHW